MSRERFCARHVTSCNCNRQRFVSGGTPPVFEALEPRLLLSTLYWDPDGNAANNNISTGAGLGGSDYWTLNDTYWFDPCSPSADVAWTCGYDDAVFLGTYSGGTAGPVSLTITVEVHSLTFQTDGYTVQGYALRPVGCDPGITVVSGLSATITSCVWSEEGLVKDGPGVLVLTSYVGCGDTTILNGTLRATTDLSSNVTFGSCGSPALVFDQDSGGEYSYQISGDTGSVTIEGGCEVTLSGMITGGVSLTVTDDSTATLTCESNDYSGGTTVESGATLRVTACALPGDVTDCGSLVFDGTSLEYGGTISGCGTVQVTCNSEVTLSGSITGEVSLTVAEGAEVELGGTNDYTGLTTVESYATLRVGTCGLAGDIANDGELVFEQESCWTYEGDISGDGSVTVSCGEVALAGTNIYGGTTTIAADGTLLVQGTCALPGGVTNNGTLVFDLNSSCTYSFDITGDGSVTVEGGSDMTLAGENSYIGGTTVDSDGTLRVEPGNLPGDVTVNGTLVFIDTGGTYSGEIGGDGSVEVSSGCEVTFDGMITGGISLVVSGGSDVTLTYESNDYTGGTMIDGATLRVTTETLPDHAEGGGWMMATLRLKVTGDLDELLDTLAALGVSEDSYSVVGGDTDAVAGEGAGLSSAGSDNVIGGDAQFENAAVPGARRSRARISIRLIGHPAAFATLLGSSPAQAAGIRLIREGPRALSLVARRSDDTATTDSVAIDAASGGPAVVERGASLGVVGGILTLRLAEDLSASPGASGGQAVAESAALDELCYEVDSTVIAGGMLMMEGCADILISGGGELIFHQSTCGSNDAAITGEDDGGSVTVTGGGDVTLEGDISGELSLTVTCDSCVTPTGSNSYSGGTTIESNGTLQVGKGALPDGVTDDDGTLVLVGAQGDPWDFGGQITGEGTVTVTGDGEVELSCTSNDYTGETTVDEGATFRVTTCSLPGGAENNGILVFDQNFNDTYDHTISGSGSVAVAGGGAVTFCCGNTYEGDTFIWNGTLVLGCDNALPTSTTVTLGDESDSGKLVLNGHEQELSGLSTSGGNDSRVVGGSGVEQSELKFAGGTLDAVLGGPGTDDDNLTLIKTGGDTLSLSCAGTYRGPTQVLDGTLSLECDDALSCCSVVILGAQGTGGILRLNGHDQTIAGLETRECGDNQVVNDSEEDVTLTVYEGEGIAVFYGILSDEDSDGVLSLVKAGSGTLELQRPNNYRGVTTISGGALRADDGTGLPTYSRLVFEGGMLETSCTFFGRSVGCGCGEVEWCGDGGFSTSGTLTVNLGDCTTPDTLTWGSCGFVPDGSRLLFEGSQEESQVEFQNPINLHCTTSEIFVGGVCLVDMSGALTCEGGLCMSGGGTLELSGENTYTGGTSIRNGTIMLACDGALPSETVVTLGCGSDSGKLVLNGLSVELGGLATVGIGTANQVVNGSVTDATLTLNVGEGTFAFAGILGGSTEDENRFDLVKAGLGTQVLTGATCYSSDTTVSAGTLQGTTSSLQRNILNYGQVVFNQNFAGTYSHSISGTGSVAIDGGETVEFSVGNSYGGATFIRYGTLELGGNPLTAPLPTGTALTLGDTQNHSGILMLNGHSVTLSGLATSGSGTGNRVINGNSWLATLTVNVPFGITRTFSGALGGSESGYNSCNNFGLIKLGGGTQVLAGGLDNPQFYTGGTEIRAGKLHVDSPIESTANVKLFPGADLDGDAPISSNIFGVGPGGDHQEITSCECTCTANGLRSHEVQDLQCFGVARAWTNAGQYSPDTGLGSGWSVAQWPTLFQNSCTQYVIIENGTNRLWFECDVEHDTYQASHGLLGTLIHDTDGDEYVLADTQGNITRFHDFTVASDLQGKFKGLSDPAGNDITATYDENGRIAELECDLPENITETYSIDYGASGRISCVTLSRSEGSYDSLSMISQSALDDDPPPIVHRAVYSYYGDPGVTDPNGNTGDLRSVTIVDGYDNTIETNYYRYYTTAEDCVADGSLIGYPHALEYAFEGPSYARLLQAVEDDPELDNVGEADDTFVAPYADLYQEFDIQHRITRLTTKNGGCSSACGGLGTHTYEYEVNPNAAPADDYNFWVYKTIDYLPGYVKVNDPEDPVPATNTRVITYFNGAGQIMLDVTQKQTDFETWTDLECTFYAYDSEGREVLTALPSAVTGYDQDNYNDLLNEVDGNYQYLDDSSGLVTRTTYYTTSAERGTVGGAEGYVSDIMIQRGDQGEAAQAIQAIDLDGTIATVTLPGHSYTTGERIVITGSDAPFNGIFVITRIDDDHFCYTVSGTGEDSECGFANRVSGARVASIDCDGTTAIVTLADHGYQDGDIIAITDVDSPFHGVFIISVTDPNEFTYTVSSEQHVSDLGAMVNRPILQETLAYIGHEDADGNVVYPVASRTVYPDADGPGIETRYSYSWLVLNGVATNQQESQTVTYPYVPTGQNGPGEDHETEVQTWYDSFGRPIWTMDAEGYINYAAYDPETGAVVKTITDVDTVHSHTPPYDYSDLPSGWATPTGGGLHLVTLYEVDPEGRMTKVTDPNGNVTYIVYNDAAHETRTYAGWVVEGNPDDSHPTVPIMIYREDWAHGYTEDLTISTPPTLDENHLPTGAEIFDYGEQTVTYLTRDGSTATVTLADHGYDTGNRVCISGAVETEYNGVFTITRIDDDTFTYTVSGTPTSPATGSIKAERLDDVLSLSRSFTNRGGQTIEDRQYFSFSGLTDYTTEDLDVISAAQTEDPTFGIEGTNFLSTTYAYCIRGWLARTEDPTGTIHRTVYHPVGRTVSEWVGTDDTPANPLNPWSPTNNGGNMVEVAQYFYDEATPGSGESGFEDGNLTSTRSYYGDQTGEYYQTVYQYDWRDRLTASRGPDGVTTHVEYDNLGNARLVETYADTTDPFQLEEDELRARTESLYDDLGRLYRTCTYEVDPVTGEVEDCLTSNIWYNARGMVVKTADPNGLFQKTQYDGAGRPTYRFLCFDDVDEEGGSAYDGALTVDGDSIIEQARTIYDAGSRPVASLSFQRLENDTTTCGELDFENSYATASVAWYDRADRLTYAIDFGHDSEAGGWYIFDGEDEYDDDLIDADGDGIPNEADPDFGSPREPNCSDDCIVTKYEYNEDDFYSQTTDNLGHIARTYYDLAGRTTCTIANYDDGPDAGDTSTDQTTEYVYDSAGRLSILRAWNPQGTSIQYQDTRYFYACDYNRSWATNVLYPDSVANPEGSTTTITGLVQEDGIATATAAAHGYSAGDTVRITDAEDEEYNGWFVVIQADTNTFKYAVAPSAPPQTSGTITANRANQVLTTFDRLGRTLTSTDQRGVVHTYFYDSAGRLAADAVTTLPSGVDGSVRRIEWTYDDVGRVATVTSFNDPDGGTLHIVNQVAFTYDGWGNVVESRQAHDSQVDVNTPAVLYEYDDAEPDPENPVDHAAPYVRLASVTYPDGRVVTYHYDSPGGIDDKLSRLTRIADEEDETTYAEYTYLGAGTIIEVDHPAVDGGLTLSYGSEGTYAGWDRFGRVLDQTWTVDDDPVDSYTYTYDRNSNRLTRTNVLEGDYSEVYTYDGLDRLVDTNRAGDDFQDWTLDALGNWSGYVETDGETTTLNQTREHDEANETTDIDATVGAVWITPEYDAAGSMILAPKPGDEAVVGGTTLRLTYDGWNRLVEVESWKDANSNGVKDTGEEWGVVAVYEYDGLGRRIEKTVDPETGTAQVLNSVNYTEEDDDNRITVTASAAAVDGLENDEVAQLYTDAGSGAIGEDFRYSFEITLDSQTGGHAAVWAVSNEVDALADWDTDTDEALSVAIVGTDLVLTNHHVSNTSDTYSGLSTETKYYCVVERPSAGRVELQIYSDADHTVLIDTLSVTVSTEDSWQYLFAVNSYGGTSSSAALSFDVENLVSDPPMTQHSYFNESWQVLEERADGAPSGQYLWDIRYIDAPVLRWRDADVNPATGLEETLYYANDANMNVTALVDASSGNVVERYVYTPYGEATFLDGQWQLTEVDGFEDGRASTVGNVVLHTGRPLDAETGLYSSRVRTTYHPTLGVWTARDPAAVGMNLYEYCRSNPLIGTDPSGLFVDPTQISSGGEVEKLARLAQDDADMAFKVFRIATNPIDYGASRVLGIYSLTPRITAAIHSLFRIGALARRFNPGAISNGTGNKFVYTCKGGWIDVGHYAFSALAAYASGPVRSMALGYLMEVGQTAVKYHPLLGWILKNVGSSAFTYEDIPSDWLGSKVGPSAQYSVLAGSVYDFAGRLAADLRRLGAVHPGNVVSQSPRRDAKYWLEKDADDSRRMHLLPTPVQIPHHHCVCDKNNEPINLGGAPQW